MISESNQVQQSCRSVMDEGRKQMEVSCSGGKKMSIVNDPITLTINQITLPSPEGTYRVH